MTELLEGYSPPANEPKEDDPEDKEGITIRIILLCDGTNNNKVNIAEREKSELGENSDSYEAFADVGHGADSSYDNGRTNIAIMEPHVDSGKDVGGYSAVVKVYVEGQGTLAFNKDNDEGLAFASGLTGVYQRARTGILEALNKLNSTLFAESPPELFFIRQVDVDVFGFSRGAATARHAIYVLTTTETITVSDPRGYGSKTVVVTQPLFERLRTTYSYREMREDQVKIIFAGLYDTVVSVAASQLMPAWIANNTRDQQAVAKAKFALHLAAADEHRADFPVHTIKSSLDVGKGAEYYFPGVHSDIGGSYNLANDALLDKKEDEVTEIREVKFMGSYKDCKVEQNKWANHKTYIQETAWTITRGGKYPKEGWLWVYRKVEGSEFLRPTSEVARVINRGLYADMEKDKANLIKDGWYEPWQLTIETNLAASAARLLNPVGALINLSAHSAKLIANRENISNGYCNIPLKFMVEHTRKHAIVIKGKLDDRINTIMQEIDKNKMADELKFSDVEAALRKYMSDKGLKGSVMSDWTNINSAMELYPKIMELRNKHLHMSARFQRPGKVGAVLSTVIDPGFTPRFEKNLRRRFHYDG